MTKQNSVDVWPNAAIWMRDELRSKVRTIQLFMPRHVESSHGKYNSILPHLQLLM